jgi:hypothetical protein
MLNVEEWDAQGQNGVAKKWVAIPVDRILGQKGL